MGTTQPQVSAILSGTIRGISADRMLNHLEALGYRVTFVLEKMDPRVSRVQIEPADDEQAQPPAERSTAQGELAHAWHAAGLPRPLSIPTREQ